MSAALALLSRASGGTGSAGAGYHKGRGGLALAEHHAGHRGPYAQPPGDPDPGQGTADGPPGVPPEGQHGLSPGTHQARGDPRL